jgi:OmpA-OmpF porin, OOP family
MQTVSDAGRTSSWDMSGTLRSFACAIAPAALAWLIICIIDHQPPPPPCPGERLCPGPTVRKRFPASGLFDFDKLVVNQKGRASLEMFVGEVKTKAAGEVPTAVIVVGHADRFGSAAYNERLSRARAAAVEAELKDGFGWPQEIIHSYGRGEEVANPAANTSTKCRAAVGSATQDDKACHEPDRRVEVSVFY